MRRRLRGLYFSLVVLLLLCLPIVSQAMLPENCEHREKTVTQREEATCTEDGFIEETCTMCSLTFVTEIPALGHSYVETVTAPTCTGDGVKTRICSRCGDTQTESIPATGHKPTVIPAVAATCTAGGKTEGSKCSVCGTILTEQKDVAVLGHAWDGGSTTRQPTCTEQGVITYTCTRCYETDYEYLPAKGHQRETIPGKDATCTEKGKTPGVKCSVCGTILEKQKSIPAKGHKEKKLPGKEATCTEAGLTEGAVCKVCGAVIREQQKIKAKGHMPETIWGYPATCEKTGLSNGEKCTRCGEILKNQEAIPAQGHDWDEGVVTKEAGYLEPGEMLYTCRRDPSHTKTEEIPVKMKEETDTPADFMSLLRGDPPGGETEDTELHIVTQPASGTMDGTIGAYELSVEAEGGRPPYTYEWHHSFRIGKKGFDRTVGDNENTYYARSAGKYYCIIRDRDYHEVISDTAQVYRALCVSEQPKNANLRNGESMICRAEGGKAPYEYRWSIVNGGTADMIAGAPMTENFDPAAAGVPAGTTIVCVVVDANEQSVWSDRVAVYDAEPLQVGSYTAPVSLRKGEKATFKAFFLGGVPPYTVTWSTRADGSAPVPTTIDETGFYTTEVTSGEIGEQKSYYCVCTDYIGNSVYATTSYTYRGLSITQQPQGGDLSKDGGIDLTIAVEGGKAPYTFNLLHTDTDYNQVKEMPDGNCTFTVTKGGWCDIYVEDAEGNYAYSDTAIVNGYQSVHFVKQSKDIEINDLDGRYNIWFIIDGGTPPYVYEWEWKEIGSDSFSDRREKTSNEKGFVITHIRPATSRITVTDNNGEMDTTEIKVTYTSSKPIIVDQPSDALLVYQDGSVSTIISCKAITGSGDDQNIKYVWFKRDLSSGGWYSAGTGSEYNATAIGVYYCKAINADTGESTNSHEAEVKYELSAKINGMTGHDSTVSRMKYEIRGGVPPYKVSIMAHVETGERDQNNKWEYAEVKEKQIIIYEPGEYEVYVKDKYTTPVYDNGRWVSQDFHAEYYLIVIDSAGTPFVSEIY